MTEKRKEMFERTVENLKKRMLHTRQADTNRLRREEGTLWKNIR